MEIKNNSATNDSNSDDFLEDNSSQESQHSRKSVISTYRSTSRRETKAKKFDCKKEAREKFTNTIYVAF